MEDPLDAFADVLEDDTDEETGGLRELDDYGRFYEYNNGLADFSIWDGVFESRQRTPQSLVAEVVDRGDEVQQLLADDFGEVASTSALAESSFYSTPSPDIAPPDPELRSEMLELMSIFQVLYENKSAIDTRSLLKKCIYMCERIMERYYRLPQVVAMHEQAKSLLQMFENGGGAEGPSNASSNFAPENTTGRPFRNDLIANVKEALDSVDRDAKESDLSKDPDEGREVNGVYSRKGIWYCRVHIEREQCRQCGVDYRLLNQVHRSRTEEAKIDDIIRKEQQRLEELERQRIVSLPRMQEGPTVVYFHSDAEDFQSIAKDLNEELARAREKDKVNSLKCYASFPSSEERKLVL